MCEGGGLLPPCSASLHLRPQQLLCTPTIPRVTASNHPPAALPNPRAGDKGFGGFGSAAADCWQRSGGGNSSRSGWRTCLRKLFQSQLVLISHTRVQGDYKGYAFTVANAYKDMSYIVELDELDGLGTSGLNRIVLEIFRKVRTLPPQPGAFVQAGQGGGVT